MKPLIVLISTFIIFFFGVKLFTQEYDVALAGQISMSVMLGFTSIGHFAFRKGMAMMVPKSIPYKSVIVFLTGLIELAAAIGLFFPNLRLVTAWLLIAFFIAILPANIYAAVHKVDYQKGSFEGKGLTYLWFRVPLQVLYIGWVYFFVIYMLDCN